MKSRPLLLKPAAQASINLFDEQEPFLEKVPGLPKAFDYTFFLIIFSQMQILTGENLWIISMIKSISSGK